MDPSIFNWLIIYSILFAYFIGRLPGGSRGDYFAMCIILSMAPLFIISTVQLRRSVEHQRDIINNHMK